MFQLCGESEGTIAADLMQCELEVENKVLNPLQTIDVRPFLEFTMSVSTKTAVCI